MADNIFPAVWQVLDGNGDPVAGAKAYFYDTGTTNARTVYSDSAGLTAHASPLVADGDGVFPEVFVTGGTAVKVVVKTSADVDVYTQDPVTRTSISSGASGISFTPTAEIAQTNVQDAIEQVQANLDAGAFTNITASGNVTVTGSLVFGGTTLTDTTGADTKLVSGTAGTSGNLVSWNGDGDAVDSTFAVVDEDDMTSDSATKVPTQQSVKAYVDANGGGMEFISSVDLSGDAVADFTLTAGYDIYVLGFLNVVPASDNVDLWLRTSTNGGSSFDSGASDYEWGGTPTAAAQIELTQQSLGSDVNEWGYSGTVEILGPHLSAYTRITVDSVYKSSGGTLLKINQFGERLSTTAIDAVRVLMSSGNMESGTITLWGMKNA